MLSDEYKQALNVLKIEAKFGNYDIVDINSIDNSHNIDEIPDYYFEYINIIQLVIRNPDPDITIPNLTESKLSKLLRMRNQRWKKEVF